MNAQLDTWLATATRDLCDDAKARVCAEVEAHFAAAYDAMVAQGHSQSAAQGHAMELLGSARKARRRYARTFVTRSDNKLLKDFEGRGTAVMAAAFMALVVAQMLLHAQTRGATGLLIATLVSVICLSATIGYVVVVRFRFAEDVRRSLGQLVVGSALLAIQAPVAMAILWYTAVYLDGDRPDWLGNTTAVLIASGSLAVAWFAFTFLACARLLRIRRKLAQVAAAALPTNANPAGPGNRGGI